MMTATANTAESNAGQQPFSRLVRIFERRYFLVLAAVAGLILLDQAVVQPLLVQMNAYAPAINIAGRQRMLSQRLTKAALKWQLASDAKEREAQRQELAATRHDWAAAHAELASDQGELSLPSLRVPSLEEAWSELQPQFAAMNAAAKVISDARPSNDRSEIIPTTSVSEIVDHEAVYLKTMDRVVKLLELEAAQRVRFLRITAMAIAATVLVLLVALGWLVVRPATKVINVQVDELELRVAQRTRELAEANASLEREIVEHAAAVEKTQLLAAQLAHAARVSTMGHLTAGLSHELNQPLAAIVNYAETCELLLDHDVNGNVKVRQHFEQIKLASARAGKILHRMRDFVRPTTGTCAEVDLNTLVREVAELCRFEADRGNVQLSLAFDSHDRVAADAIQIQQVLVNLLRNAFHAIADADAATRCVTIRTTQIDNAACVEVIDTGPGFAVNETALFSPFYTTKADGLGLGLAICKTIVERHSGKISARSSPSGAIIGFTLPCVALAPEKQIANSKATEANAC
jgi:two-component system, LuxR family, sensor kinase FixL